MDLRSEVSEGIWRAVQQKYESGLLADAVLEAMKVLTSTIREKAMADGDGASLVGQALGGQSPKIKLNKMESTSERDEQRGFEQLLRGLYQGIRNPRTHETYEDTKDDADALIHFVDFVCRKISDTKSYFELSEFKKRVFDKLFVEKDEYAELIVSEVPHDELVDAVVSVLRDRAMGDQSKLQCFFRAVFNRADAEQTRSIVEAMSNELRTANSEDDMIGVIRLLQGELWSLVDDDVKLRTENSMIDSVKQGKVDVFGGGIQSGHCGTWASDKGEYFKLRRELAAALIKLLRMNWYTQNYVGEYFFQYLPSIVGDDEQVRECCSNLAYAALSNKARKVREKLDKHFNHLPLEWREQILESGLRYRDEDPDYFQKLSDEYIPF